MGKRLLLAIALGALTLVLRVSPLPMPPFDDLYHLKRFAAFPHLLDPDPDRGLAGAFCPWPPLYDFVAGGASKVIGTTWLAPLGFALFVAFCAWQVSWLAALALAISPYLIGVSRTNAIDHHWVEPALMLFLLYATKKRSAPLLALSLLAAMFVQTAFLAAAAIAFVALFIDGTEDKQPGIGFAAAALVIALYRLTRPDSYPDSAWFLGWVHAGAFTAAAVALALRARGVRPLAALGAGALVIATVLPMLLRGAHFFGGDPWLSSIVEFQPMFRDPSRIGTDIANLTGGALLSFAIFKRHRTVALFAIVYLLLALSSRRFLVPAIPLFAVAASLAFAEARSRVAAFVFVAMTIAPPLAYVIYDELRPEVASPMNVRVVTMANRIAALPPGRVLAPWSMGHAIDVIGRHPVVIDNFGSMPDEALFTRANEALRTRDVAWCRAHGIRYIVIGNDVRRID
ncbi:MAG: hypothetical protein QOI24_4548 [Acidobacteriota bacterium]|nr:hypothetical protein [Acidobacteriota bacterium]